MFVHPARAQAGGQQNQQRHDHDGARVALAARVLLQLRAGGKRGQRRHTQKRHHPAPLEAGHARHRDADAAFGRGVVLALVDGLHPLFLEDLDGRVDGIILSSDAELGLAFDGDGDRLGIVTKDGQNIFPDRQMMLFAQDVLSRVPGAPILFDVKCTQRLAPAISAAGGEPVMYKTGHSLIKARMKEVDSPLGGEMSGHIFFKERWFGFDDGTYAGCRLLEILSRHADPGAVLQGLPTSHSTPELNVACAEGEPHRLTAELQALAPDTFAAPAQINTIDGLRVDWPDGFGLIRASNTTPVLVLRFEGHTPEALHRIEAAMLALLQRVKPDAQVGAAAH